MTNPRTAVLLADAGKGGAVGYALCAPMSLPYAAALPGAVELKRLYVDAAAQGRGLGRRLLAAAVDWAVAQRAPEVYLGVYCENFGAQRLYAAHGFAKVGEYAFAVGRHRDHEFILRRPLGPPGV
ncbi:MAG: GNAT family N-acetyltransferase [Rhodospirillaceae bacterium]|nr:GNAT family N-acetyltransferase [Rhodospirillaceae bacterium]